MSRRFCGLVLLLVSLSSARVESVSPGESERLRAAPRNRSAPALGAGRGRDPAGEERKPSVLFDRVSEPREQAFSFLAPRGWRVEGGMFHVHPVEAGGPGNSLESKCDLTVKKDAAGSVLLRWLPSHNYADLSVGQFAFTGRLFPAGSSYQGMTVRPLPDLAAFCQHLFRQLRPHASAVNVVYRGRVPELAELFRQLYGPVNQTFQQLGVPPATLSAGGMVWEYSEGEARYRETLLTVLVDLRGAAGMWSNQYTLVTRAPAAEAALWKPVLDIMRQSVQFNPRWVAAAVRAAGERGKALEDTLKCIQNVDQEIVAKRQKTSADIQHENYLLLTGQEDYVNPFTRAVERDTNGYEYRWATEQGQRMYTDDGEFDPNADAELGKVQWRRTPVRKRR